MEIKLGSEYEDLVTGFKGIAVGTTQWLTGCDTVGLKPPVDKDGKILEAEWVDVTQIKYVGPGVDISPIKQAVANDPGGPHPDSPRA